MQKIDDKKYQRFVRALELLLEDLNKLEYSQAAKKVAVLGSELTEVYEKYTCHLEELNAIVDTYRVIFTRSHMAYLYASRLRTKGYKQIHEKTEKREKALENRKIF